MLLESPCHRLEGNVRAALFSLSCFLDLYGNSFPRDIPAVLLIESPNLEYENLLLLVKRTRVLME